MWKELESLQHNSNELSSQLKSIMEEKCLCFFFIWMIPSEEIFFTLCRVQVLRFPLQLYSQIILLFLVSSCFESEFVWFLSWLSPPPFQFESNKETEREKLSYKRMKKKEIEKRSKRKSRRARDDGVCVSQYIWQWVVLVRHKVKTWISCLSLFLFHKKIGLTFNQALQHLGGSERDTGSLPLQVGRKVPDVDAVSCDSTSLLSSLDDSVLYSRRNDRGRRTWSSREGRRHCQKLRCIRCHF
jgi:hypothetical protein